MPIIYETLPIEAELETIRETEGFIELKDNFAFQKVLKYAEELVAEAEEERDANMCSDPQITWNLHGRWKQRQATVLAIKLYVEDMIRQRMEVLNILT